MLLSSVLSFGNLQIFCCLIFKLYHQVSRSPENMFCLMNLHIHFIPAFLEIYQFWLTQRQKLNSYASSLMTLVLHYTKTQRKQWHPTPVLLPGKSHGWRSLVGCRPWGREESDTTERLPFHFSLSCIGEGNGNPPQCSCLENPRDGGAWWAAVYGVYGVAQSRTRLKRLSSKLSFVSQIYCKFSSPG